MFRRDIKISEYDREKSALKDFDKQALICPPQLIDYKKFRLPSQQRFNIAYDSTVFECFYSPSKKSKKLYVFLSAANMTRKEKKAPMFDRVSWHNWFDGYCINIEDPMYKKYPDLREGWYFGKKDISYLKYISNIVKKFAELWKIDFSQIYFIGSSSAGYAALYLANEVQGSTALAYNPQLVLANWGDKNHFRSQTGISLEDHDVNHRNDLSTILKNNTSKFIVFVNGSSRSDYERQLLPFSEKNNLKFNYGLNVFGSLYLSLLKTNYFSPHRTYFDQAESLLALNMIESSHNVESLKASFNVFLEMVYSRFENMNNDRYRNFWEKPLQIGFGEYVYYTNICIKNYLKLCINDLDTRIHYEITTDTHLSKCIIALHIEIGELAQSQEISQVFAELSGLMGYKYSNNRWHNLYIDDVNIIDINRKAKQFIGETVHVLKRLIPENYQKK